jgi:predicted enzyme involved in methoxymalonyl-ACP biosynthesis
VDRLLRTAAAFSLTGERPDISDAEVDAFLAPGRSLLVAVSDRLSDYGPSGVVASHKDGDSVDIDALALSCPVMGKQVEYALLSALAQMAARERFPKLIFEYRSSGRNQTMLSFLRSIADAQSDTRYVLPVDLAEPRIQKATIAPGSWSIELPTYLPPSNRQ